MVDFVRGSLQARVGRRARSRPSNSGSLEGEDGAITRSADAEAAVRVHREADGLVAAANVLGELMCARLASGCVAVRGPMAPDGDAKGSAPK